MIGASTHLAFANVWGKRAGDASTLVFLALRGWKIYSARAREQAHVNRITRTTLAAAFERTRNPSKRYLHPTLGIRVGRNARHAALRAARRVRSPFPPPPPRPKHNITAAGRIEPPPPPNRPSTKPPTPSPPAAPNSIEIKGAHSLALYAVLRLWGVTRCRWRGGRKGKEHTPIISVWKAFRTRIKHARRALVFARHNIAKAQTRCREYAHAVLSSIRSKVERAGVWKAFRTRIERARRALTSAKHNIAKAQTRWREYAHAALSSIRSKVERAGVWRAFRTRIEHARRALTSARHNIAKAQARCKQSAHARCKQCAHAALLFIRRKGERGRTGKKTARRRLTRRTGCALRVGLAALTAGGVRAAPTPTQTHPGLAATRRGPAATAEPNAAMDQNPRATAWARVLHPQTNPQQGAPTDDPVRPAPEEKQLMHHLQLVSYNVGSIGGTANSTSMRVFLDALRASRYDIALVQEHRIPEKLRAEKIKEAFSLGFLAVLSCHGKGDAKGGTGVFIRKTHELTTLDDIEGIHSLHGLNGGLTKASFPWEGDRLEVASIYSPVSANPRKRFLDKLESKQRSAQPPLSQDTILGGDFNTVPDTRVDLTFPAPIDPEELRSRRTQYDNAHSEKLENILTASGLEDILRSRVGPRVRLVTRPGRAMAQHTNVASPNRQVSSRIDRFYVPTDLPYEFHPGIQTANTKEHSNGNSKHGKDLLFPSDHIPTTLGISRPAGTSRTKYADERISRAALESAEGIAAVDEVAAAHLGQDAAPGQNPQFRGGRPSN